MKRKRYIPHLMIIMLFMVTPNILNAQGQQGQPPLISPEVSDAGTITFRIMAPNADTVKLSSSDIPDSMGGFLMNKKESGVWEFTTDVLVPGAYRYNFNVDGVSVADPINPLTSESNLNSWSLVVLPGDELMDTKDVPHGAVSEVTYYSETLGKFRRMHVYTPPGYENNSKKYPVFYLLHGAWDSDDSWTTVGRAGIIIDNLIEKGEAVPMVVVMPAGHTAPINQGGFNMGSFVDDFNNHIKPYVESHYRVKTDRKNTAMAGLSMGGAHTLDIAIPNLKDYAYIGVFSSGVFSLGRPDQNQGPKYDEVNKAVLGDAELKKGLKVFWFGTGKDDFLVQTTRNTVQLFKDHGFDVVYDETEGAHTWLVWRDYLIDFTPKLFK